MKFIDQVLLVLVILLCVFILKMGMDKVFIEYFETFTNKKPLKLIHITKCAGTSIEDIGKENGLLWGRFDKEYNLNCVFSL